jgi:L-serine/L-threonine ammonia-lyase
MYTTFNNFSGWQDVPVVAMETVGTDCLNLSVKAKKIVVLDKITR